jgi:phage terminase large subunit
MKVFDGLRHGHVMEYSFHPKDIPLIQRWGNITVIHLSDFNTNFSSIFGNIEEIAKSLHTLSITVNHFDRLQQRKFHNGDYVMFDGLNRTLKSVDLEFGSTQGYNCKCFRL